MQELKGISKVEKRRRLLSKETMDGIQFTGNLILV